MRHDTVNARPRRRRPTERQDEGGFVIVWFAVVIVLLLAVSAFAIDLLHGYSVAQRLQNAADAGAAAGVVLRPDDASAQTVAQQIAESNLGGPGTITVDHSTVAPNQLRVTVQETVDTFFGGIIGVDSLSVTRSSVAEYDAPVAMGSPLPSIGVVPGTPPLPGTGRFWAAVSGPLNSKADGNAVTSEWCDELAHGNDATFLNKYGPTALPPNSGQADNCADGTTTNNDRDRLLFVIDSASTPDVEVFDPVYVDVNRRCNKTEYTNFLAAHPSAEPRYVSNVNDYCTGDSDTRWNDDAHGNLMTTHVTSQAAYDNEVRARDLAVETTFRVMPPDGTPDDIYDNTGGCATPDRFEGYADIQHLWDEELAGGDPTPDLVGWRQWMPLCVPTGHGGGRYVVEVTAKPDSFGNNNFSLRVNTPGARIYTFDKMPIYLNEPQTAATFYLARVLPSSTERTLRLAFFDVGDTDASSGGTDLQIRSADEATRPDGTPFGLFTDCQYSAVPGNSGPQLSPWRIDMNGNGAPPWGPMTPTSSGCTLHALRPSASAGSDYNGQWITVDVKIPGTYRCNATDATGCWLKVGFTNTTATVNDWSTWSVGFGGSPVRIVE